MRVRLPITKTPNSINKIAKKKEYIPNATIYLFNFFRSNIDRYSSGKPAPLFLFKPQINSIREMGTQAEDIKILVILNRLL